MAKKGVSILDYLDQLSKRVKDVDEVANSQYKTVVKGNGKSSNFVGSFERLNNQSGVDLSKTDEEAKGKAAMYAAMEGKIPDHKEMGMTEKETIQAIIQAYKDRFIKGIFK